MSGNGDYASVRGVVKINGAEDVPEKLVIHNHRGPATIDRVFLIFLWVDPSNIDMSHFQFTNPPPPRVGFPGPSSYHSLSGVHLLLGDVHFILVLESAYMEMHVLSTPVASDPPHAPATLTLLSDTEHENTARKRKVRHKRLVDLDRNTRRSARLMAKEPSTFEKPQAKAARVNAALVDFEGASQRFHDALSSSLVIDNYVLSILAIQKPLLILPLFVALLRMKSATSGRLMVSMTSLHELTVPKLLVLPSWQAIFLRTIVSLRWVVHSTSGTLMVIVSLYIQWLVHIIHLSRFCVGQIFSYILPYFAFVQ
jgi:hypothetical protein